MDHLFKQSGVQQLVKYNKRLLFITLLLAVTSLLGMMKTVSTEEKWLLIPAIEPDRRMIVSSKSWSCIQFVDYSVY